MEKDMMTGNRNKASKFNIFFILASAIFLIGHVLASGLAINPGNSTMNPMTFWQVTDAISKQYPFTKEKVESILSVRLDKRKVESNDLWEFFIGKNVILADGVIISAVDFSFKKSDPSISGVGLNNITGTCITLDQVSDRYKLSGPSSIPRGESKLETWGFSKSTSWGRVVFGFRDTNGPGCLAYVAFHPKN
jgi:hypothetical protein